MFAREETRMKCQSVGESTIGAFDPVAEDSYWRSHYSSRPYVDRGEPYSEYRPAYRYGWESCSRFIGRTFDHVERELERGWWLAKGQSKLGWKKAESAVRDAWNHVERKIKEPQIAAGSR
jgi:hypothetical protein